MIKLKFLFWAQSILLVLSAFRMPYGYYTFLRISTTIMAIIALIAMKKFVDKRWVIPLSVVVILFNPVIPIYMSKSVWLIFDLVAAILFVYLGIKLKSVDLEDII